MKVSKKNIFTILKLLLLFFLTIGVVSLSFKSCGESKTNHFKESLALYSYKVKVDGAILDKKESKIELIVIESKDDYRTDNEIKYFIDGKESAESYKELDIQNSIKYFQTDISPGKEKYELKIVEYGLGKEIVSKTVTIDVKDLTEGVIHTPERILEISSSKTKQEVEKGKKALEESIKKTEDIIAFKEGEKGKYEYGLVKAQEEGKSSVPEIESMLKDLNTSIEDLKIKLEELKVKLQEIEGS